MEYDVDVIVPTKDRAEFTLEAVESVRRQTCRLWRLLVVDDGSSVVAPLRSLCEDDRIVLLERPVSGGPQAARQTGYEESTAPFVATLDSDDLWEPRKLELQLAALRVSKLPDVGAILTWHRWVDDGRVVRARRPRVSGYARPTLTNNMSAPLFARWALEAAGGFLPPDVRSPLPGASHMEFWFRIAQVCSMEVVEEVLVTCRTHTGSRASDALRSVTGADNLAYVAERHRSYLSRFPSDHAGLLARIGGRYLSAGDRERGFRYLRRALGTGSPADGIRVLRTYGPLALRSLFGGHARAREGPTSPPREDRMDGESGR